MEQTELQQRWDERNQWFLDRVGKRVYRNKTTCDCLTCENVYKKGIVITDETDANYLHSIEVDFTASGDPTHYFDTIEERDTFEKTLLG